MTYLLTAIR